MPRPRLKEYCEGEVERIYVRQRTIVALLSFAGGSLLVLNLLAPSGVGLEASDPAFLPQALAPVYGVLGAAGGLMVLAGGMTVLRDRMTLGRWLITVGTGFGLFGFIMFLLRHLDAAFFGLQSSALISLSFTGSVLSFLSSLTAARAGDL